MYGISSPSIHAAPVGKSVAISKDTVTGVRACTPSSSLASLAAQAVSAKSLSHPSYADHLSPSALCGILSYKRRLTVAD